MKSLRNSLLCLGMLCIGASAGWAQAQQDKTKPEDRPLPPWAGSLPKLPPPPDLPPRAPDVRQPGETGWWLELDGWFPTQQPVLNSGHGSKNLTYPSYVTLQGKPKLAEGAQLGVAIGQHNTLRFIYWDSRASGNLPSIPGGLSLLGQNYAPGTYVSTDYRLQHGKVSFDYLSWPYPVEGRRFRLKTLWQVQYTSMRTTFNAPELPVVNSAGGAILDASGNPISYVAYSTRWFVSPEFGVAASYYAGRHLRFEAEAAGFAFPKHDTVWDGDASANLRVGKMEFRVGAKILHFKTSPTSDFFMHGTDSGAFVGVRWNSQ